MLAYVKSTDNLWSDCSHARLGDGNGVTVKLRGGGGVEDVLIGVVTMIVID